MASEDLLASWNDTATRAAKPVRVWSRVGRRLLVRHDDGDREFDYATGAEESLRRAADRGWTVISVKDDWTTVFADI